jgi:hypothetical protein
MSRKDDLWRFAGVEPQKGQYFYKAEDKEDGTPWISANADGSSLKIIGPKGRDLGIGFTLRPGTTNAQAKELAQCMNKRIAEIQLFNVYEPD